MMQHGKRMSPAGLASTKQEINNALIELEARPSNTQSVYTNLTRVFDALADHPQAQLAVDSALSTQKSVKLLSELVRIHLREEEVQWVLGRVILLSCQASVRFQCQVGELQMWNELYDMRSAHPLSIRVQEASMRASEFLFRNNEFHATKLRPRCILDDLLGVMDRFLRVQTPQRRAHKLVVLALCVLVALYSSPRPTELMLFSGETSVEGEKWALEISKRLLESFAVFNRETDSIRSWFDMILILMRQHPIQVIKMLFSPPSKEITWWFDAVIEKWQAQPEVVSVLLAPLTHIFALPHNTLGDEIQVTLADKLILEQNLLDIMCGVIDHYSRAIKVQTSSDAMVMVLLEAIRVVRQWSERPKLRPRFEASRSVNLTLLPVLIEQLQMQSSPTKVSSKRLVFVLEILLVLRHLAVNEALRGVLVGNENLQMSLKWLLCIGGTVVDDSDVDALVAREARNLHKLIATDVDAAPKGTIVMSKAVVAVPRRQKLGISLVKPQTLAAYSVGKR